MKGLFSTWVVLIFTGSVAVILKWNFKCQVMTDHILADS
jgi:hypothetical protein